MPFTLSLDRDVTTASFLGKGTVRSLNLMLMLRSEYSDDGFSYLGNAPVPASADMMWSQ